MLDGHLATHGVGGFDGVCVVVMLDHSHCGVTGDLLEGLGIDSGAAGGDDEIHAAGVPAVEAGGADALGAGGAGFLQECCQPLR